MTTTYRRSVPFTIARAVLGMPDCLIQRIAGDPVELDGRVLKRSVQLLLKLGEWTGQGGLEGGTVGERRAEIRRATRMGTPMATNVHVFDRVIPGPSSPLRIRTYRPFGVATPAPAIVFYHGGGWVLGDLDTHDGPCRILASESRCVVVSVQYRLAPEHRFPAPVDDAKAAYGWVVTNAAELAVDPSAVAVMGDSAGGNLAAVVSQEARNMDVVAPVAQGLIYPATDFRLGTRSVQLFAEGFFLTRSNMDWFLEQYLPDPELIHDPLVSPLLTDDIAGVAPAWIWTAGFDPLRDEGRAYADRLAAAGVATTYRCYDDLVHGFFSMGPLPGGIETISEMSREMGELIRTQAAAR